MPIYAIHIEKTICETMEIEADSPEEAENIYTTSLTSSIGRKVIGKL